jgi:hypothetical protein
VDLEPIELADHEQWRVVQRLPVDKKLVVCGLQVPLPSFVLPPEATALPHVGESVASACLLRSLLECVLVASRILVRRRRAEQLAQVDEVFLRRGSLPPVLPFHLATNWATFTSEV